MPIALLLGGFHLMMSYLGRLSRLMKGAGLKELFQTIYGVNAVEYVLSGKAVSRALRDHFTLESALTTKLLKEIIQISTAQDAPYRNSENNEYQSKFEFENEESDPDNPCEKSLQMRQCTQRTLCNIHSLY